MSDEHRVRLAEITWNRRAAEKRKLLYSKLLKYGEFEFLDHKKSNEVGEHFWCKAKGIEYVNPNDLKSGLAALDQMINNHMLFWFHRYTNDAGVIVIRLDVFLRALKDLQNELGPDILVAECNFEFGLCFEVGESDSYLRLWGLNYQA